MAKYNPELLKEIVKWVEVNGLYPQRCGAPIKQLCEQFGITWDTYKAWSRKSDFSDAIKRANEHFSVSTLAEVTNALKKKALGHRETVERQEAGLTKVIEYDPVTGKKKKEYYDKELKTVKAVRETLYFPPDTPALIFMATNLDANNWVNTARGGERSAPAVEPPRPLTAKELREFRGKLEEEY